MRRTVGVVLIVGLMLIAIPITILAVSKWMSTSKDGERVENTLINGVYGNIRDGCTETLGDICGRIFMHPHEFEFHFKKVRKNIARGQTKHELGVPTLNIYMTGGAWGKIVEQRVRAFRLGGLAFGDDPKVWANAEMTSDIDQKPVKVRMRLKGKSADHVEDSMKMSFRVEVKNGEQVFGMSEFSIHAPNIRQGSSGAITQEVMKRFGVLAAGTMFVDVRINNELVGIMGLEEYFTKEMLEVQGRRESAMVGIDDEWDFAQMRLNIRGQPNYSMLETNWQNTLEWDKWNGGGVLMPLSLRDYPVQMYNIKRISAEGFDRSYTIHAMSILRDVIDARRSGFSVYDYNLLARFWIIAHVFSGQHGLLFVPNRRHYFNPITGLLEPVSYDLNVTPLNPCLTNDDWIAYSHWEYPCVVSDVSIRSIWADPRFRKVFWKEANDIRKKIGSEQFEQWFTSIYDRYEKVLKVDGIGSPKLTIKDLENNLEVFLSSVRKKFVLVKALVNNAINQNNEKATDDNITAKNREITTSLDILHTHIRPFWFKSKAGIHIELKNLTLDPVLVHSVFVKEIADSDVLSNEIMIPAYRVGSNEHVYSVDIAHAKLGKGNQLWITYSHKNKVHTRPVIWQARNYQTGYESDEIMARWFRTNNAAIDREKKIIVLPPGHYVLPFSIETRVGWQVKMLAGVVLEFQRGARLRVNGPVHIFGSEEAHVKLVIEPDLSGTLKSWGGLLVVNADEQSTMQHVLVSGSGKTVMTERQDARGLTGCVTFYRSNVTIKHSRFSGLHCEDALNIILSRFEVDYVEIHNSNADALDSDFSQGRISNSTFRSNHNDDLDISNSNVELYSSTFLNAGDKSISAGEGSKLEVRGITIKGAAAGIVSKDRSVVNVWNSSLTDVGTGLMAYRKKNEWGSASLNCYECVFREVGSVAVRQSSSTITLDGENVWASPFSREQLRIAGYVRSNP